MTKYGPIEDLGVVIIDTTDDFYPQDPGLAGVALLNAASETSLQSYVTLQDVEKDYPAGTKIYAEAAAYFNNDASPLFQVINYASGSTQASAPVTSSNGSSGQSAPVITVGASSDADSAVAAVKKYFGGQWEHLIVPVTSSNHDVAIQVAEFVEAQNNKLVYLEIPADSPKGTTGPDFSFLKPLLPGQDLEKGALSVTAQSAPNAGDANDYDLDGALLSVYANSNLGYNPILISGLEKFSNVRHQSFYDFVKSDLDKYYTPYNVWTYAYRTGDYLFTSNFSIGGYEIMPMFTRDALIKEVKANILNLFEQNGGLQYNTPGINMILDQIRIVLNDFTKRGLIQNASVTTINPDKIKEATKASGHLSGLGWTWQPVWGINDVTFHQGIELTEL